MKKIISAMLSFLICILSMQSFAAFPDIDAGTLAWAGEAIEELQTAGIINGYEDGTFRPESNVTRAEFAKMLCAAFGCTSELQVYDDIGGHWAEEYIIKSADYVYTPTDDYNPDVNATRAEIAYALAIAAGQSASEESVLDKFADADTVAGEIAPEVAAAVEAGFIKGYEDGSIRGNAPVTRAEAAALIFRAMSYQSAPEEEIPSANEELPGDSDAEEPSAPDADDTEDDSQASVPADSDGPSAEIYDELLAKGHIYTLYPSKYVLLISSATKLYDEAGEDVYKLSYRLAGDDEEYESVVAGDTVVAGVKQSMENIEEGDVVILDTGFWGHIGCLYVLVALDDEPADASDFKVSCPASSDWSMYPGSGEYEIIGGKLESAEANNKSYTLTLATASGKEEITVARSCSVDIYNPDERRTKWESDELSALIDSENTYVFVRYTDGRASEVAAAAY